MWTVGRSRRPRRETAVDRRGQPSGPVGDRPQSGQRPRIEHALAHGGSEQVAGADHRPRSPQNWWHCLRRLVEVLQSGPRGLERTHQALADRIDSAGWDLLRNSW